MLNERPSYEELSARLLIAEESLKKSEGLAIAGRYAGAVMYEINNPLEAIGNLVFLTKYAADNAAQVCEHMRAVESQLVLLGDIARKSLSLFVREKESKTFDLGAIVEAATSLHFKGLPVGRVQ